MPDPEVFWKAAEFLALSPAECLVVEDAKAGMEAAYRGRFESAGIGEVCEHEHVIYKMTYVNDLLGFLQRAE